jgi:hypothetical protein
MTELDEGRFLMINRLRLPVAMAALVALQPLAVAGLSAAEPNQAAPAADPSAAPSDKKPNVAQSEADKSQQKICRSETPTGSIRPVRTCHTRAEWEAAAQQGQANKDQMNTNGLRQQQLQSSHG